MFQVVFQTISDWTAHGSTTDQSLEELHTRLMFRSLTMR